MINTQNNTKTGFLFLMEDVKSETLKVISFVIRLGSILKCIADIIFGISNFTLQGKKSLKCTSLGPFPASKETNANVYNTFVALFTFIY